VQGRKKKHIHGRKHQARHIGPNPDTVNSLRQTHLPHAGVDFGS
jgi:5'-3' exonuclease